MSFNIQPTLENDQMLLAPLQPTDYDALYAVAADPAIWAQHPQNDRWKEDVFRDFFDTAIKSHGAFKIIDKTTGEIAGSTRYYEFDPAQSIIHIGYTFYATKYWGTGFNKSVKKLMLDYAFQFVDNVGFHVGAQNFRSQIAVTRLGAIKVAEIDMAYPDQPNRHNFVYNLPKNDYLL
ncbi:GNAT family N-acetyltransferase [Chitinophaga sancti]|uniref:GNAT family N-acetyltransferase n=1 Tax=Chitinophaga sancti TaxID=1004 RepID=UPI002A762630|nr:GNAT family N-acetyltransferase [Chitinophaga sancti]WPQ63516.1 GNAT family N-acetyltransferase [Chitinophaga sancti]